ncbi:hypothetical protein [Olleya sp. HaHaR_3_96]|uniref:hypothetical protein n=1 Tax=Olleya sp. HaHaR_3_96 TaxID=2745560 RepID=UPI001C4FBCAA|nr:hypothetical protein [Olleya sp. HaHaR_3_96]QXP58654.1 hypothetical protein H0I26_12100 [Olleya sp. HaHaR_3_96]
MGWKNLLIFSAFLLCVSCNSFYQHPEGGFRPKKPKFSVNKNNFSFNTKIDTLAIYANIDTLKYGQNASVYFYKFFNNGNCFLKSFDAKKHITKTELKPGFIGHYQSNNNGIEIEIYNVNVRTQSGNYETQKGIIKGDSLILENQFIDGKQDIFIKQTLDFLPVSSNW